MNMNKAAHFYTDNNKKMYIAVRSTLYLFSQHTSKGGGGRIIDRCGYAEVWRGIIEMTLCRWHNWHIHLPLPWMSLIKQVCKVILRRCLFARHTVHRVLFLVCVVPRLSSLTNFMEWMTEFEENPKTHFLSFARSDTNSGQYGCWYLGRSAGITFHSYIYVCNVHYIVHYTVHINSVSRYTPPFRLPINSGTNRTFLGGYYQLCLSNQYTRLASWTKAISMNVSGYSSWPLEFRQTIPITFRYKRLINCFHHLFIIQHTFKQCLCVYALFSSHQEPMNIALARAILWHEYNQFKWLCVGPKRTFSGRAQKIRMCHLQFSH